MSHTKQHEDAEPIATAFINNHFLFEWHWDDVYDLLNPFSWDPFSNSDQEAHYKKQEALVRDFIYEWFSLVEAWENNLQNYDTHFSIVDSWVSEKVSILFGPIEYMAIFGVFITISHDLHTFMRDKHEDVYYNLIWE